MPYERCIETWAREEGIGLIPGPGRRCPGQIRIKPGAALDRVCFIRILWPEIELFSCFLDAFFKTCDTMRKQWVVKSKPFSKLVMLCLDNGRAKVMICHAFYKNRISILRKGVRLGCNLY